MIRRHHSARHMIVRYQPHKHFIQLTLPRYASIKQGLRFVKEQRDWIASEMSKQAKRIVLADGVCVCILGSHYTLKHIGGRGLVKLSSNPLAGKMQIDNTGLFEYSTPLAPNDNTMLVPGDSQFFSRRVNDWLKKFAGNIIEKMVHEKSQQLGVKPSRISLRDASSHWGSCSSDGSMSFSWRLVMAPYDVLEYIVCHEVAHLEEMNHSKHFWKKVEEICPHWQQSREWLNQHGGLLHTF